MLLNEVFEERVPELRVAWIVPSPTLMARVKKASENVVQFNDISRNANAAKEFRSSGDNKAHPVLDGWMGQNQTVGGGLPPNRMSKDFDQRQATSKESSINYQAPNPEKCRRG